VNLQVGRILFNYDLPWNPMAVEQRIGRVHRYGQKDTVQVYNLLAEDTVEAKIYDILERKLLDIARSIGHVDESGTLREDFRWDVLGYLGSRPDYQELYKMALVDRDYQRTEAEIEQMIKEAVRARDALNSLTQDLSGFNLENYRALEGHYSLEELGVWVRDAILRLGGGAIPDGDFWTLITPESLKHKYHLAPRFEGVCFNRDLALRTRKSELGGIGHPLVNALIDEILKPDFQGSTGGNGNRAGIHAHYLVKYQNPKGHTYGRLFNLLYEAESKSVRMLKRFSLVQDVAMNGLPIRIEEAREAIESGIQQAIIEWLPDRHARGGLHVSLIGLHFA
jgi:hypothetical protein